MESQKKHKDRLAVWWFLEIMQAIKRQWEWIESNNYSPKFWYFPLIFMNETLTLLDRARNKRLSASSMVQLSQWGELKCDHASLRTLNNWKVTKIATFVVSETQTSIAAVWQHCDMTTLEPVQKEQNKTLSVCLPLIDISGKLWTYGRDGFFQQSYMCVC